MSKQLVYKKQNLIMAYIGKKKDKGDDKVVVYDGDELDVWTLSQYYKVKNNRYDDDVIQLAKSADTIIAEYDKFMAEVKKIRLASKGKIKYLESGIRHKEVALKLFDILSMGADDPEQINELEEQWLQDAMQGALIFAEVCDLDDAVCIDVNSAYPNAMRNTGFSVPMKQGDFSRIAEFPEFIAFGIYRCIIKKSGNKHTDKLFRFNKTNKYTHIDIANAKQLGLKVTLIIDDEANCLLYGGGKRINGSRLFKSFIDFLYPMKCNGVEFAKKLLEFKIIIKKTKKRLYFVFKSPK